jgi:hypothetical protein
VCSDLKFALSFDLKRAGVRRLLFFYAGFRYQKVIVIKYFPHFEAITKKNIVPFLSL